MAKKSATETKKLEDSCTGTKKELKDGGFTCRADDGKWITCTPNDDDTSNCWVSFEPDSPEILGRIEEAIVALEAAQLEARSTDIRLRRAALTIDRLKHSMRGI